MVKQLFSRWQVEADCMASNEKHKQRWLHQDHDHEQRRAPDDQDHDHEQRRTRAPVPRWLPDDHDDDSPRTVWVAKIGYRYHMDFDACFPPGAINALVAAPRAAAAAVCAGRDRAPPPRAVALQRFRMIITK